MLSVVPSAGESFAALLRVTLIATHHNFLIVKLYIQSIS